MFYIFLHQNRKDFRILRRQLFTLKFQQFGGKRQFSEMVKKERIESLTKCANFKQEKKRGLAISALRYINNNLYEKSSLHFFINQRESNSIIRQQKGKILKKITKISALNNGGNWNVIRSPRQQLFYIPLLVQIFATG